VTDTAVDEDRAWQDGRSAPFSVRRLTAGRPFCAGVLVTVDGSLLVTLSADTGGYADGYGGELLVGGVGGGQEPGEDVWGTAIREAAEELGVTAELLPSPRTYLHDLDSDSIVRSRSVDEPAPFALQRARNQDATTPFRPGLPTGPYTYFSLFLARLTRPNPVFVPADDDVVALLWLPLAHWHVLDDRPPLRDLIALGATVAVGRTVPADVRIALPARESLRTVAPLLARDLQAGED
jgi:8-oxo-dGTP pyrophosphatase MutT (NUDIX family)